jgi:riboflavin kinase/FMN adenylyltransferase
MNSPFAAGSPVITIGNFDGIHLGHQTLIHHSVNKSIELNTKAVMLSFTPHPGSVLQPQRKLTRLFDYEDQKEQAQTHGITNVFHLCFDKKMSKLSPEEFFKNEIITPFHPQWLVVGQDFRFGYNRAGDIHTLQNLCRDNQIGFTAIPQLNDSGEVISSSRIRDCLSKGDLQQAKKLLGRDFQIQGYVVHGKKIGRTIGFPTLNLKLADEMDNRLALQNGVYRVIVKIEDGSFVGVMNIGKIRQ